MCKKKCFVCKQPKNDSELNAIFKHQVCNDCLEEYLRSDSYCKEKFLDDVWQTYVDKPNFMQLLKQYEALVNTYNFTPQGLLYALQYYMKRYDWNTDYLLYQAFPKLYYEARDYYIQEHRIKKKLKQISQHDVVNIKGSNHSIVPPLDIE